MLKIRYILDCIVIIVIVVISFYTIQSKQRTGVRLRIIPIVFANFNDFKNHSEIYKSLRLEFPPKRNYTDINLTGDAIIDKIKLDFAQVRIREILLNRDSLIGVHFKFGDNTAFKTFINVLDVCKVEGAKNFMPYTDNLFVYYLSTKPTDTVNEKNRYLSL